MDCGTCRYYDPADGYCVMQTDYRRETDLCEAYEQPKKWLLLMDKTLEEETWRI